MLASVERLAASDFLTFTLSLGVSDKGDACSGDLQVIPRQRSVLTQSSELTRKVLTKMVITSSFHLKTLQVSSRLLHLHHVTSVLTHRTRHCDVTTDGASVYKDDNPRNVFGSS